MTLRHLKVFVTVVDSSNNLTRAAEKLYTTQPAVSMALKEIENEFGIILFDRLNRRLVLSAAGKEFEKYARRILNLEENLEQVMNSWGEEGKIYIGSSITIGSNFMPDCVRTFSLLHPKARVFVKVYPSDILMDMLKQNEIDFALLESDINEDDLVSEPFLEDRLVVITPNNDFFLHYGEMDLESFCKENLLLREKGSGVRNMIDLICEMNGLDINPYWESMSTNAIIKAVIRSLGISVLPLSMVRQYLDDGLVLAKRLKGIDLTRKLYIVRHKDKMSSALVEDFIDMVRNYEMDWVKR